MLNVIRVLKLMWPIWSCCMTYSASQTSCIFYSFLSLNPSLKSRLSNIPNMIWHLFLMQCAASLIPSNRNWKDYFKYYFSYLILVHICVFWRAEVNLFSVAWTCFLKRCLTLCTELKKNLSNCSTACSSCLSGRYWWYQEVI